MQIRPPTTNYEVKLRSKTLEEQLKDTLICKADWKTYRITCK